MNPSTLNMRNQIDVESTYQRVHSNVYERLRNVFKERLKNVSKGTFFKRFYGTFNTGSNEEARQINT